MQVNQCQQCSKTFKVTDSDQKFYDRLDVPAPTHCPDCRAQRRFARRNERNLYQDQCDLCKKDILSAYSEDKNQTVYCRDCWYSDKWDDLSYGRDFDFKRPFFEQFYELQQQVPRINLIRVDAHNSDYINVCGHVKNCYLTFGSIHIEDCYYGSPYYSKNCVDSLTIRHCELCYQCVTSDRLYHCKYCQDCFDSNDLMFCYDCKGCSDCIGCAGLRNKSYCVFNKELSKDEYLKEKERINLCNPESHERVVKNFEQQKLKHPRKYIIGKKNENVTGNYLVNCAHTFSAYDAKDVHKSKYLTQIYKLKDGYDVNHSEESELMVDVSGSYNNYGNYYSFWTYDNHNTWYCDWCNACKDLFGCIGMSKKRNCILNKKYSKAEYEKLKIKIIENMKKTGEWGEFFPIKYSYFGYNETVANDYYPLKEESVKANDWLWKGKEEKDYQIQKYKVYRDIQKVYEDICEAVLACKDCRRNYKIILPELKFYKQENLPIPKHCPDCRHLQRMAMRTSRSLWHRQCMCTKTSHGHEGRCQQEFETAYSPDGKEMVYCEHCYNKEIL